MQPRPATVEYALGEARRRMAYLDWGDPDAPIVLCVHGLTRNGRDFDALAMALMDRFRVVCVDLPGRGASDWLQPAALYQPLTYLAPLTALLIELGREVAWVGTSLGGICGMLAAATPGNVLSRLVLNDIGPFIPRASLARIAQYIGGSTEFPDLAALEAHLRRIHAPFGILSDAQWRHMANTSARTLPDGRVALHYDPAIAVPIQAAEPQDVDMWPVWDAIRIPRLVIRGESSDLLLPETLERMAASGAETFVVPDAGHAPALLDAPSIARIRTFLETR